MPYRLAIPQWDEGFTDNNDDLAIVTDYYHISYPQVCTYSSSHNPTQRQHFLHLSVVCRHQTMCQNTFVALNATSHIAFDVLSSSELASSDSQPLEYECGLSVG